MVPVRRLPTCNQPVQHEVEAGLTESTHLVPSCSDSLEKLLAVPEQLAAESLVRGGRTCFGDDELAFGEGGDRRGENNWRNNQSIEANQESKKHCCERGRKA